MADEEVKAPPEPVWTHYERRNNILLDVHDNGQTKTYKVCDSINQAKRLSRELQKKGMVVKVDHAAEARHRPRRRTKVITKKQSAPKILKAGPRLDPAVAKEFERSLIDR